MKVKIIKDYRIEINNPSCKEGMYGCIGNYVQVFKVGEIVDGGFGVSQGGLSSDGKYFVKGMGNWTIQIPIENVQLLNDDGTPASKTNSNLLLKPIENINMTAEDKLYEKLGIKFTEGGWGLKSRPMGRLLVLGVLIAGYFAYKKFNK